jgi:hypothetical protein
MANEFFTDEYTSVLNKLVNEVVNDPKTYVGAKYLPSIAIPTRKVRTEVVESSGGLTNEHIVGTDPSYIQGFGSRVQEYETPAYKEAILYDEKKILDLRELGQNDTSKRGIRQYIDKDIDRLNRRLEARIEKQRWDAIFNGSITFGSQVVSFGIPNSNRVTPAVPWSTDGINVNNSANPIIDIRYWVTGGYSPFRKYKITGAVVNPNTARWILDNQNTRAYVQNALANPNVNAYSLDQVIGFFIPGAPAFTIYNGWYQPETIVNGKITVSEAVYMIPDGMIFWEVSLPGDEAIGEFVQGLHLSSGTIDSPGYGKFLIVEENIASGTKGGPKNPYIDIVGGVYGGVKLDRPFDVLTAKVIP